MVDGRALRSVAGIDALERTEGRLFFVVGVFDGLHLGHLYLLRRLGEEAAVRGARPAVITFDHHPDEILTGAAPALLCDPVERLARLRAAGVAVTVVQHFDVALRLTGYEEFVRRIAARVDVAGLLMTPDSAFGHERRGTPAAIAELGGRMGYDVVVVPPLDLDGRPVRSAEIRADIASGAFGEAARLLGRPYAVVGELAASHDHRSRPGLEGTGLEFAMPVALPPVGEYPVGVQAAGQDRTGKGTPTAAVAVVSETGLSLQGAGMPTSARLRVTFG